MKREEEKEREGSKVGTETRKERRSSGVLGELGRVTRRFDAH
jgi:hypothetical protein